jgi:hypothetical protein
VIAKIYGIGLSDEQFPVCFISDLNISVQGMIFNLHLKRAILWHCVEVYTMQWNLVDYEWMLTKLENHWMATLFWIQTEGVLLLVYRDEECSVFALFDPLG